jgi:hypothetical protein
MPHRDVVDGALRNPKGGETVKALVDRAAQNIAVVVSIVVVFMIYS